MMKKSAGDRYMQICVNVSKQHIEILDRIIKKYPNISSRSEAIRALIFEWSKKSKGEKDE